MPYSTQVNQLFVAPTHKLPQPVINQDAPVQVVAL